MSVGVGLLLDMSHINVQMKLTPLLDNTVLSIWGQHPAGNIICGS